MHGEAHSEWTVEYYIDDRGRSPVEDFLNSLDLKAGTRFIWLIERLRVLNVAAREPLVKKLDDKLWELRAESRTNIFRVCYCYVSGRRIIQLHAFRRRLSVRRAARSRSLSVVWHDSLHVKVVKIMAAEVTPDHESEGARRYQRWRDRLLSTPEGRQTYEEE